MISTLRIKSGDILLVKYWEGRGGDSKLKTFEALGSLCKTLEARGIRGTHVLFLSNGCDLQSMPEQQMNRAGWFRESKDPGRDGVLLKAYREKRTWDGVNGRRFDPARFIEAEKCISRLGG